MTTTKELWTEFKKYESEMQNHYRIVSTALDEIAEIEQVKQRPLVIERERINF